MAFLQAVGTHVQIVWVHWRRDDCFDYADRAVGIGKSVFFLVPIKSNLHRIARVAYLADLVGVVFCDGLFVGDVVGRYPQSNARQSRVVLQRKLVLHAGYLYGTYVVSVPVSHLHAVFFTAGAVVIRGVPLRGRYFLDAYPPLLRILDAGVLLVARVYPFDATGGGVE